MSDDRAVIEHPLAIEFDDCVQIDPPWQSQMAAEGAYKETHLARCFLQIVEWVQTAQRPFFLWCHLGSLGATWDAPLECRERYWDESDPPLLSTADVPDRMLEPGLRSRRTAGLYAGIRRASRLAGHLPGRVPGGAGRAPGRPKDDAGADRLAGIPHGRTPPPGALRRGSSWRTLADPLFLRFPDRLGASGRSQSLVEPADVWATLLDHWRIAGGRHRPLAFRSCRRCVRSRWRPAIGWSWPGRAGAGHSHPSLVSPQE